MQCHLPSQLRIYPIYPHQLEIVPFQREQAAISSSIRLELGLDGKQELFIESRSQGLYVDRGMFSKHIEETTINYEKYPHKV